ncbi:MAG: regulatory iron-sulfur-containing complex subunit RicT [Siphonobacter sp.]
MGCASCGTGGCGSVRVKDKTTTVSGCRNNGACGTGGCNKMNVFDWLLDMEAPGLGIPMNQRTNLVEVKFKGGRKEYFRNIGQLEIYTGDPVVVEMASGHHIGYVSLQGELVRLQLVKRAVKEVDIRQVYRKATPKDIEKYEQAVARDLPTMYRARDIVKDLNLNMKLSDVEFQADGTKATFYYSSDERVDFRELIKILAGEFKVRIEMKQISLRQEAARLGGLGVCGRELCCSTWLTDFKNVTTSAARYQNLSLNPVKLSGQCGRLKCCLNYELETYMDALRDIPTLEKPLLVQKGEATLQKTDIFRKIMWFGFRGEDNWYPVAIPQVLKIVELNKKGIVPPSLEELELAPVIEVAKAGGINSDLERMDKKFQAKNRPVPNANQSPNRRKKKPGSSGQKPSQK